MAAERNIVVITSDQHNPKIMGCAGNKVARTPNIDRLAREDSPPYQTMCRSQRWKLIWYPYEPEPAQHVLYDMEQDPDELAKVAGDPAYAPVVQEHKAQFDAFRARIKPPLFPPLRIRREPRRAALDQTIVEPGCTRRC